MKEILGNTALKNIAFEGKAGEVRRRAILPGTGLHKVVPGMPDPGAERAHLVWSEQKGQAFLVLHNKSVEGNLLGDAGNRAQRFISWATTGFNSNFPKKEKWMTSCFSFKCSLEDFETNLWKKAQSNKDSVVLKSRKAAKTQALKTL